MKLKSGLKFDRCETSKFRLFVDEEWEYTLKRSFSGMEEQAAFTIRPPTRVFPLLRRVRASGNNFPLPK